MKEKSQGITRKLNGGSVQARQADQRAYDDGWDAGKRGVNTVNAHFSLFASKQGTASWQQGYDDAKAGLTTGKKPQATAPGKRSTLAAQTPRVSHDGTETDEKQKLQGKTRGQSRRWLQPDG